MRKYWLLLRMLFDLRTWRWLVRWLEFHYQNHASQLSRLAAVGENTWIEPTAKFTHPENIRIGRNCHINHLGCLQADSESSISIGDNFLMGPGTMIFTSNYRLRRGTPMREQERRQADVTIGDDVWLGSGVVVTAGVTIGSGAVVGAGSVVTRDIPEQAIAGGIPAKVLKERE